MKFLFLFCSTVLLCSCAEQTPSTFGLSLSQWNQLTIKQRQNSISSYQIQNTKRYKAEPKITMDKITKTYSNQLTFKNPITIQNLKPITLTQKNINTTKEIPTTKPG